MQKLLTYQLTDGDWHLVNRMVAVRMRTQASKDSAELEGAAAEVGFARIFGLDVPEPVYKKGDGGIDFVLPSGATVDVKAISGNESHRLGLLVPKRTRAGLYVLVHIDFQTRSATVLGYQTGGFAATHGQDKVDHWRVHQRDLRPASEILNHMGHGSTLTVE